MKLFAQIIIIIIINEHFNVHTVNLINVFREPFCSSAYGLYSSI